MSGGSMNYLYLRIESDATFSTDTQERKAFADHLAKVAKALHDIEWVDSSDYSSGDENEAIRACLGDAIEIERLREALTELRDRIIDHPAYADLTEAQELEDGGDTAELSYLARVANMALVRNAPIKTARQDQREACAQAIRGER